jgi:WhiB family redox-sensing transcriptional regulator
MDEALTRWLMLPDAPDTPVTLEDFLQRPDWHRRAACRGEDVAAFTVDVGRQYDDGTRRLCAGCQVRRECLKTALADDSLQGMWAGTTPVERRQMRRGRAVA